MPYTTSKKFRGRSLVFVFIAIIFILAATTYAAGDFLYGDANDSGAIDVGDAIIVLRHIVGLSSLEGTGYLAADVDGSSDVDVADVILILRKIVGLTESFPAEIALNEAIAAVEKAEQTKLQEDVDAARILVNSLPDIPPKAELSARLDAVQAEIDGILKAQAIAAAIAAIDALPDLSEMTLEHKDDVEAARGLVNIAKNVHGAVDADITNLARLEAAEAFLSDLEVAEAAVAAAEASQAQADVDNARALVAVLPGGVAKSALNARLDAVQAAIDKAAAIAAAIAAIDGLPEPGNLTLEHKDDVAAARDLVNAAKALGATDADITNLDKLTTAEVTIAALEAATYAVEAAEASMSRDDVNFAFGLVIELPDGPAKASLLNRLEVVLTEIEKQAAIAAAIAAIDALPEPGDLTLDHKAVVATARNLVNAARDRGATDADITNLDKLVTAEKTIEDLEKATLAVEAAEQTRFLPLINYARSLVGQLPDGGAKAALNARLDALEALIPVALVVELAEAGDKEPGEAFEILLTIVNKFSDPIPYADAPGTTIITSSLDGELFSGEIAYNGANGEARVPVTLQTRGLHLITAQVLGVSGTLNVNVPISYSAYQMSLSGPAKLSVGEFAQYSLRTWSEAPFGNSSLDVAYEYAITGGDYELYVGVSQG